VEEMLKWCPHAEPSLLNPTFQVRNVKLDFPHFDGFDVLQWIFTPMWLKRLTLEGEIVRNRSVSLSPTLAKNEKVEHYIRIKTHKPIALRFWVESGVNVLCGWVQVSLVLYLLSETFSVNLT